MNSTVQVLPTYIHQENIKRRLFIAYFVSVVSQYMSSPTTDYWAAVEQILCYLKGVPGRGILYNNNGHNR